MKNRWNIEVQRGMHARANHPRGGYVEGTVTKLYRVHVYGWRVALDDGAFSCSIDDVSSAAHPVPVVVRRHKESGDLELFFANDYADKANPSWWIECFNPREGHSEVSRFYMTRMCDPVPVNDPDALKLAAQWGNYGPDKYQTKIVRALRGPRGHYYGGE